MELLDFGPAETHLGGSGGGGKGGATAGARRQEATLRLGAARTPNSSATGARCRRGVGGAERETGLSLPAALMAAASWVLAGVA